MPTLAAVVAVTGLVWLSTTFHPAPRVVPSSVSTHDMAIDHPVSATAAGALPSAAGVSPEARRRIHASWSGAQASSAVPSRYPRVQTVPLSEAELAVLGIVVHEHDDETTLAMVHDYGPGGPRMFSAYGDKRTYSRTLLDGEESVVPAVAVAPDLVTTATGVTRETRTTDITVHRDVPAPTVSSKPVIEIYLQPGDTMSAERQYALEADTSREFVRVRRLTQSQADSMARVARKREEAYADLMRSNELVGVRLRSDRQQQVPDLIFWYRPTPAFVASLPPAVGAIVRDELSGTASGCRYVQRCQEMSTLVRSSLVRPNPASDVVTFSVDMATSAAVRCVVRSIDGTVLRTLRDGAVLPAGPTSIDVAVADLDNGVYLLSLEPLDGSGTVVQRIVVRH